MIELIPTRHSELPLLIEMEQAPGTREFIIDTPAGAHRANLDDARFVYLSVVDRQTTLGFLILHLDSDERSVEFRRILIAEKNHGAGQAAIVLMEAYCRTALKRSRVWLDVFANNAAARHVYEKLGFQRFGERCFEGRALLLYHKLT